MGKTKQFKSSQKNKKTFFDESDSENSSIEENKSSSKKKQQKQNSLDKMTILKYLGGQKKNKGGDSSDETESSNDENVDLKCHHDYSSYSTTTSSTSEEMEPTFVSKKKPIDSNINNNKPIENDKIQTVVYTFSVMPSKKNSKDYFTITSEDLKIQSSTNPEDIERASNYKERASLNSDIVTFLSLNIKSEYQGMVTIEFPTVKCLNGTTSVGFNPFVSKTSHYQELTGNGKTLNFIGRDLTSNQLEFLEKYPGHTSENLKEFCTFLPGNKFVHVGLQPPSCLIEYYDGTTDKKILETKKGESVLLMNKKSYTECSLKAQTNLEKNYAFSNVTGKEFCINLRPVMNSTVEKTINSKINSLKQKKDTTDKNANDVLKGLQAKGFSNFYMNHPCPTNEEFDTLYKSFLTKKFQINGELTVKYMQIKKQQENY